MSPYELYKDAKSLIKLSGKIHESLKHPDGIDYVGEFRVRDFNSREWKIKVRETGNRGRYLKLKAKVGDREVRASADNYKPGKYARITPQEWSLCVEYATGDETKHSQVLTIVNRLVN